MTNPGWAPSVLIWLHLAATLYLCGLIWCIQVVHYPLMSAVAADGFSAFHRRHSTRIAAIVVAPMVVELLTAAVLAMPGAVGAPRWMPLAGLALVLVVWGSTFGLQVPLHGRLASAFDTAAHRSLVRTNWLRTVAWTLRAPLAVIIAARWT